MPSSKVQQLPNGSLVLTIPKTLAELTKIVKGDVLEWDIKNQNIILKKLYICGKTTERYAGLPLHLKI